MLLGIASGDKISNFWNRWTKLVASSACDGQEGVTAKNMLFRLMENHGMTLDDVSEYRRGLLGFKEAGLEEYLAPLKRPQWAMELLARKPISKPKVSKLAVINKVETVIVNGKEIPIDEWNPVFEIKIPVRPHSPAPMKRAIKIESREMKETRDTMNGKMIYDKLIAANEARFHWSELADFIELNPLLSPASRASSIRRIFGYEIRPQLEGTGFKLKNFRGTGQYAIVKEIRGLRPPYC